MAAALAAASVAWAQSGPQDGPAPESVGERFNQNNAAPGAQIGPWTVTPTAALRGGYDDNVTTVPDDAQASPFVQLRGRVDAVNADGPNEVAAYAQIEQTWFTDAPDLDHFDASGGLSFRAQVSDYVRIRGSIGLASVEEEDSSDEGVIIGGSFDPYVDLARYISVPASLGVTFDTGRWYVTANGDISYQDHDDRVTRGGVTVNQDFRSGTIADLSGRAGWRFSPATSVFVEGGYNIQRFKDETADSDGWRAVAGAQFEFSRLLTGEVFAGYASQSYPGSGEVNGLTYGASLNWFVTDLVSLQLRARRDFGAERTAIIGGLTETSPVTRDSITLRAEYEPLRQLLISTELGWRSAEYDSQNRTDTSLLAGLGAEYVFSPNFRLGLDYRYEETSSDVAGDSTSNVISLGLTAGY